MKKMIPISKEITFRTMIGEMTEVSLEHTLALTSEQSIEGNLVVKGRYKMTEASTIEEDFKEEIPVLIDLDEKYDTTDVSVDIDDFYYEIINEDVLRVHVDIAVDGLVEREDLDQLETEVREDLSLDEDKIVEQIQVHEEAPVEVREVVSEETLPAFDQIPEVPTEVKPVPVEVMEKVTPVTTTSVLEEDHTNMGSIFTALQNTEETFSTYYVYIVRENDTVDSILEKYKTTRECLSDYNNLDDIRLGTKLIIPCPMVDESH